MSSKVFLRIASVLMLIHCILHTIGFDSWKGDPDKQGVYQAMNGPKFPFMGVHRNMIEFYDGFGYASTIAMVLIVVALWVVSTELASGSLAKKMILILAIILVFWGIDEIIFFFPLAAGMSWLSGLCAFVAYARLNKQT